MQDVLEYADRQRVCASRTKLHKYVFALFCNTSNVSRTHLACRDHEFLTPDLRKGCSSECGDLDLDLSSYLFRVTVPCRMGIYDEAMLTCKVSPPDAGDRYLSA